MLPYHPLQLRVSSHGMARLNWPTSTETSELLPLDATHVKSAEMDKTAGEKCRIRGGQHLIDYWALRSDIRVCQDESPVGFVDDSRCPLSHISALHDFVCPPALTEGPWIG